MGFPNWREAEEVTYGIIFCIHKSAKRWDPARMGCEPRLDRMGNGKYGPPVPSSTVKKIVPHVKQP